MRRNSLSISILLAMALLLPMLSTVASAAEAGTEPPIKESTEVSPPDAGVAGDSQAATELAPDAPLTRGEAVGMLWTLEGEPVVNYMLTFEDVLTDEANTEAIRWASAMGIACGYSETTFGPEDPMTREQLMTILYAYAKKQNMGFTGAWMFLLAYDDIGDISDWAYEAACWCAMKDIVSDNGENMLEPKGIIHSVEATQMLNGLREVLEN